MDVGMDQGLLCHLSTITVAARMCLMPPPTLLSAPLHHALVLPTREVQALLPSPPSPPTTLPRAEARVEALVSSLKARSRSLVRREERRWRAVEWRLGRRRGRGDRRLPGE